MIVDILKIKSDNSFEFECSFNEKINNFRKKNDSFKMNMENWISSSFKELSNIFNETATTQRPETALNAVNPKFS